MSTDGFGTRRRRASALSAWHAMLRPDTAPGTGTTSSGLDGPAVALLHPVGDEPHERRMKLRAVGRVQAARIAEHAAVDVRRAARARRAPALRKSMSRDEQWNRRRPDTRATCSSPSRRRSTTSSKSMTSGVESDRTSPSYCFFFRGSSAGFT